MSTKSSKRQYLFNAGEYISHYVVIKTLGKGSYGEVYQVEWEYEGETQKAALKIITERSISLSDILQETTNWARVCHRNNIIKILYADQFSSRHGRMIYILSELADCSMEEWLKNYLTKNQKPPPVENVVKYMHDILTDIEYIHQQNILHRDLKPGNILFVKDVPKIADFGSARANGLMQTYRMSGVTPPYCPPEWIDEYLKNQLKGKDPRQKYHDLWSFAVIFYQLMTGVLPFKDTVGILSEDVDFSNKNIPQNLQNFLNKAFQKSISNRFQDATEMRKELDKVRMALDEEFEARKLREEHEIFIKKEVERKRYQEEIGLLDTEPFEDNQKKRQLSNDEESKIEIENEQRDRKNIQESEPEKKDELKSEPPPVEEEIIAEDEEAFEDASQKNFINTTDSEKLSEEDAEGKSSNKQKEQFLTEKQYLALGLECIHKHDYDEAIENYSEALNLNPDNAYAYNNRGTVYYETQNYYLAIEDYNKAIGIKKNFAAAYRNRAKAFDKLGGIKRAKTDRRTANKIESQWKIYLLAASLIIIVLIIIITKLKSN